MKNYIMSIHSKTFLILDYNQSIVCFHQNNSFQDGIVASLILK